MSELVPCRECRRHVRAGTSCPFCGAAAQPASILRAAPRASGRFAMLFAGAIGLSACGEQASPDREPPPAPPPVEAQPAEPEARPAEPEVEPAELEVRPAELEARPAAPRPVEPVAPVSPVEPTPAPADEPAVVVRPAEPRPVEPVAPAADEPAVVARPRPRPRPAEPAPAVRQPTPDPGGAVAAYGGPSTRGPDLR